MAIDTAFLDEQITSTKAQIVVLQAAIIDLATGKIKNYSLNTGQTTESVGKENIKDIQDVIEALYLQLSTLDARRNGGCVNVLPGW